MTPIAYDPAETAFVLVDPYNDMLGEGGLVWPIVREVAEAVGTRQHLVELLGAVRGAGLPVVIAPHHRWRPGDVEDWRYAARGHRALRDQKLFADGEFGGDWYPGLHPRAGEAIATEHWAMSGFAGTDLDLQLRQRGIRHIILAGMTAPGCVEGTGRYALELGYAVTLVKDATAAFTPELMRAVEATGPLYAEAVLSTAEVIAALPEVRPEDQCASESAAR